MNKDLFKSKYYFSSDWHCYHQKSIEFDSRPFETIEEMHQKLINNYNSTVGPNDICYFLGDLGLGTPQDLAKIIKQLNGHKIFVIGNHDKPGLARYIQMGFSAVQYNGTVLIGGELVTFSHCPLLDTYREDTQNMKGATAGEPWHGNSRPKHRLSSVENKGQFHLHGHIHSPNRGKSSKTLGRQYDVGVVANNYRPVSQSTIESWIAKTKQEEEQSSLPQLNISTSKYNEFYHHLENKLNEAFRTIHINEIDLLDRTKHSKELLKALEKLMGSSYPKTLLPIDLNRQLIYMLYKRFANESLDYILTDLGYLKRKETVGKET